MKYWFISDEHYGHENIIKYCDRPFKDVQEMDNEIIKRCNSLVKSGDFLVHGGDFTLKKDAEQYIRRLNGQHIFLRGSHDYWMDGAYGDDYFDQIWEKKIDSIYVVVCHYNMRTWPRSFHGSIQLFGHSHGKLTPRENQFDISVEANNYYPVCMDDIKKKLDL
jgi:calcineurin-like phosphoesterase family protein